jgi:V/A-type H+-transporting ATPase subunit I
MIVEMKKIYLLASVTHQESVLHELRKLGVVHIDHVKSPVADDITTLEATLDSATKALSYLNRQESAEKQTDPEKAAKYIQEILALVHQKGNHRRELEELQDQHRWFERWGKISLTSLETLKKAGISVRFYIADKNAFDSLPGKAVTQIARLDKKTVYFALFGDSADPELGFKQDIMPEVEYRELESRIEELRDEIAKIDNTIAEMSDCWDVIDAYREDVTKRLEFNRVKHGMGEEEHIVYLQGYCPIDEIENFVKTSQQEGWGYVIQEPVTAEDVPTLLRKSKIGRITDPIFSFMGTLPGYNEYDISILFLVFFSIFFAMLIGDAGYGLIFTIIGLYSYKRIKNPPKELFLLLFLLSGATMLWGAISGVWFGYEPFSKWPFFNMLIIDRVNGYIQENQEFTMYLTFIVGVVHLTIAHAVVGLKSIKSPRALAQAGWILVMWSLFFVAGTLVLDRPAPGITSILLIVGAGLILIFAIFQKNIVRGILITLGDLPLSIISSFSDVVSYLRLFAVGYASVTVAASFNDMALGSGVDNIISGFLAALVLVLGHTLNIVLGLMAVVVHGIRLNMLEFSSHLDMQWSGKEYKPFKE